MAENIKKNSVVDASFVLAYLLEETKTVDDDFDQLALGKARFLAPSLLWYEVGNGLLLAVRRKRIEAKRAFALLDTFMRLEIEEVVISFDKCLSFALDKTTTFYDGAYVHLSMQTKYPLLTLDKKLQKL